MRASWFGPVLGASFAVAAAGTGCGTPKGDSSTKTAPSSVPLAALGQSTKLGGEIVVRVGDVDVTRATVVAVARAQGISPEAATRLLVEEALLAEAARRREALNQPSVKQGVIASLGQGVVARFRDEATALGPITDAELAAALAEGEEWMELDRPETRRAVHALVPKDVPGGEAVARALRDAVVSAPTPEAFLEAARAFTNDALPKGKLVAESLSPFTEDGRVLAHDGATYALPFTKAAFVIPKAGDTSEVVWNADFGWHVIRLIAIDPPHHASREQLVTALQGPVIRARVGSRFEDLVEQLRASAHVQLLGDDVMMMAPQ